MEMEMKVINWEQDFLYTTDQYQHLREQSLLVIECYTWYIVLRVRCCNIIV